MQLVFPKDLRIGVYAASQDSVERLYLAYKQFLELILS